jgi:hypothetical protein
MRFPILALFPFAALLAQTPPPSDPAPPKIEGPAKAAPAAPLSQSQRNANQDKLRKLLDGMNARRSAAIFDPREAVILALRPSRPCAVPLQNTLHLAPSQPAAAPLPVTPGDSGAISLKPVPLPAPSCDDVKR